MPNFREDLKDALQPGNAEGYSVEDLTNHYNSALTTVLEIDSESIIFLNPILTTAWHLPFFLLESAA